MKVDAHHHLWDLKKVHYPWLMEDAVRFFGDPKPIARNYLLAEFSADARSQGFEASVHIQVGAEDGFKEAEWVDMVVRYSKTWPMVQVVFCDLTAPDVITQLDRFKELDSVVGVRQIVGRAPEEDAMTGTNALLNNPNFIKGLHAAAERGFSFDLQLVPELMPRMAEIVAQIPNLKVAQVTFMNSRSSMPRALLKKRICGSVASPTPTVPICSDSTNSIFKFKPLNLLDKAAAVIQPAVPPPRIHIFFIFIMSPLLAMTALPYRYRKII